LTKVINTIYETGESPKDFTEVTMIALTWERWRLCIIFMRWRGVFHDSMEKKPFLSIYE